MEFDWLSLIMLLLGLSANLLGCLRKASSSAGGPVNPIRWARKRPYRLALGVAGAIGGFIALLATGQLTPLGAFAAGYMGDDVIDKLANAGENRFAGKGAA